MGYELRCRPYAKRTRYILPATSAQALMMSANAVVVLVPPAPVLGTRGVTDGVGTAGVGVFMFVLGT